MKPGKINYLITLPLWALLAFGCKTDRRQSLVVYSPHGKELLSRFKQLYEAKHPNVDIQWLDMGSQEVFDRIKTESKNPQADIWWGAPSTMFMKAEKMGLLEAYKPTWADDVPASAKSKKDFWYGTFSTPEVIAFNDKKLSEQEVPKDWDDLVSSKWKGKIALRSPLASGTLRAIFCVIIQQSIAQTGNEKQGWKWLKQLDDNTSSYAADATQMYTKLGGNNKAVTLWNMPDIALQKQKYNYPFGYVFPEKGTVVLTDAIAIVNNTKNPGLAKSFYEFVTSKESLAIQAKEYYRIPSRTDIDKKDLPAWLSQSNYKVLPVDWELISQNEADWMEKWDSEIKSKK
jgi:iron(III) transport system substrate-binding protein